MLSEVIKGKIGKGIPIGLDYRVGADGLNIILYKRHTKKTGEDDWDVVGYFSSLPMALRRFAQLELFGTGFSDLESVNNKLNEIYDIINKLKV